MKGKLIEPLVLSTFVEGKASEVIIPSGAIIEVTSDDDWEHTVTEEDLEKTVKRMDGKVLHFPKGPFHQVLDDLSDSYKAGRVVDLAIVWRQLERDTPTENADVPMRTIHSYWFGDRSSFFVLGMVRRLEHEILKYIDNAQDDWED